MIISKKYFYIIFLKEQLKAILLLSIFSFLERWREHAPLLAAGCASVTLISTSFSVFVFSEYCSGNSNVCFWNVPHFSTSCLHWKLPTSIFRRSNWDNSCRFWGNSPKTILGKKVIL